MIAVTRCAVLAGSLAAATMLVGCVALVGCAAASPDPAATSPGETAQPLTVPDGEWTLGPEVDAAVVPEPIAPPASVADFPALEANGYHVPLVVVSNDGVPDGYVFHVTSYEAPVPRVYTGVNGCAVAYSIGFTDPATGVDPASWTRTELDATVAEFSMTPGGEPFPVTIAGGADFLQTQGVRSDGYGVAVAVAARGVLVTEGGGYYNEYARVWTACPAGVDVGAQMEAARGHFAIYFPPGP